MKRRSFLSLMALAAIFAARAESTALPLLVSQPLDANGRPAEIAPMARNVIAYISGKTDLKFEMHAYPWRRALKLAEEGDAAIWGLSKNAEREKIFVFSHPVYATNVWMVVRKDRQININTIQDLKGMHVSVPQGGSYNSEFESARQNKLFIVEDDPHSLNIRFAKLIAGRSDVMLVNNRMASVTELEAYFATQGFDANLLQIIWHPLMIDEIHIAILKSKLANFPMDAINRAIDAGRKSGDFDRM